MSLANHSKLSVGHSVAFFCNNLVNVPTVSLSGRPEFAFIGRERVYLSHCADTDGLEEASSGPLEMSIDDSRASRCLTSIAVNTPTGKLSLLVVGIQHGIQIFDATTRTLLHACVLPHLGVGVQTTTVLAFTLAETSSPTADTVYFAFGCSDGTISVVAMNTALKTFSRLVEEVTSHGAGVTAMCTFVRSGTRYVATADCKGTIMIRKPTATGNLVVDSILQSEKSLKSDSVEMVSGVQVLGSLLIASYSSGVLRTFDLANGGRIRAKIAAHARAVQAMTTIELCPGSEASDKYNQSVTKLHLIVTCGADGYVNVWVPNESSGSLELKSTANVNIMHLTGLIGFHGQRGQCYIAVAVYDTSNLIVLKVNAS